MNPTTTSATTPYTSLIFAVFAVLSLFPMVSIVNHPHVNITTAVPIIAISKNFTIATTLPFPQKFCGQKK